MKQTIDLVRAPTMIQPGGYIPKAYPDAGPPLTPSVILMVDRNGPRGWVVHLAWPCAEPVDEIKSDTNRFADAAALLAPVLEDTPMISMGTPEFPVEGVLWRADWIAPVKIAAEGFGTVARHPAPAGWRVEGTWKDGVRTARFEIPDWPALATRKLLGIAIWQGAGRERAGLKSVCGDWIPVTA